MDKRVCQKHQRSTSDASENASDGPLQRTLRDNLSANTTLQKSSSKSGSNYLQATYLGMVENVAEPIRTWKRLKL